MSQYTVLSRQNVRSILDDYTEASITSFKILKGGQENTNYLVETSVGKYVLTVSESKSKETALLLARLLQHLNNNGIKTSNVKATLNDDLVSVWHDKPILLKDYIEGEVIRDLSADLLKLIGEEMGKLHQIDSPEYLPDVLNYDLRTLLGADQYESDEGLQDWFRDMHVYISGYMSMALPKSVIHGDLFWNNVIVSPKGADGAQGTQGAQAVTTMDYEEACYYYRIFDVGMAIVGLCSNDATIDLNKARAFLKGYQQEIHLEEEERRALKPFVVIAAASITCWRHNQFNYRHPSAGKNSLYKIMKELADHTRGLPDACFEELL